MVRVTVLPERCCSTECRLEHPSPSTPRTWADALGGEVSCTTTSTLSIWIGSIVTSEALGRSE
jgi:hypothetical protein